MLFGALPSRLDSKVQWGQVLKQSFNIRYSFFFFSPLNERYYPDSPRGPRPPLIHCACTTQAEVGWSLFSRRVGPAEGDRSTSSVICTESLASLLRWPTRKTQLLVAINYGSLCSKRKGDDTAILLCSYLTLFYFHFNLKLCPVLYFALWQSLEIQIPFCN